MRCRDTSAAPGSGAFPRGICGRLDGIAATADLLNKNLGLDWHGRRTALPRHQTLRTLLDWSYGFLPDPEQLALRRLSMLVGAFTFEAATAVVHGGQADEAGTLNALDALVAKCLVSAQAGDDGSERYRLLDTTRIYAREKLQESGETPATARRHAEYFAKLLKSLHAGLIDLEYTGRAHALLEHLGNVRAALEWCFRPLRRCRMRRLRSTWPQPLPRCSSSSPY